MSLLSSVSLVIICLDVLDDIPDVLDDTPDVLDDIPDVLDDIPDVLDDIPDVLDDIPDVLDVIPDVLDDIPDAMDDIIGVKDGLFDISDGQRDRDTETQTSELLKPAIRRQKETKIRKFSLGGEGVNPISDSFFLFSKHLVDG